MANRLKGDEEVTSGKDVFIFSGNFDFAARLKQDTGIDPLRHLIELEQNQDPQTIMDVLCCSLKSKNGKEIFSEKDVFIKGLIDEHGLNELWVVALHILANCQIGDEKKLLLQRLDDKIQALEMIKSSMFLRSKSRRLLWVYMAMTFGTSLCTAISLHMLLGA